MTADKIKRKLAAILSADVKGCSRLMGEDEFTVDNYAKAYSSYKDQSSINEYIARLRKAGLK